MHDLQKRKDLREDESASGRLRNDLLIVVAGGGSAQTGVRRSPGVDILRVVEEVYTCVAIVGGGAGVGRCGGVGPGAVTAGGIGRLRDIDRRMSHNPLLDVLRHVVDAERGNVTFSPAAMTVTVMRWIAPAKPIGGRRAEAACALLALPSGFASTGAARAARTASGGSQTRGTPLIV